MKYAHYEVLAPAQHADDVALRLPPGVPRHVEVSGPGFFESAKYAGKTFAFEPLAGKLTPDTSCSSSMCPMQASSMPDFFDSTSYEGKMHEPTPLTGRLEGSGGHTKQELREYFRMKSPDDQELECEQLPTATTDVPCADQELKEPDPASSSAEKQPVEPVQEVCESGEHLNAVSGSQCEQLPAAGEHLNAAAADVPGADQELKEPDPASSSAEKQPVEPVQEVCAAGEHLNAAAADVPGADQERKEPDPASSPAEKQPAEPVQEVCAAGEHLNATAADVPGADQELKEPDPASSSAEKQPVEPVQEVCAAGEHLNAAAADVPGADQELKEPDPASSSAEKQPVEPVQEVCAAGEHLNAAAADVPCADQERKEPDPASSPAEKQPAEPVQEVCEPGEHLNAVSGSQWEQLPAADGDLDTFDIKQEPVVSVAGVASEFAAEPASCPKQNDGNEQLVQDHVTPAGSALANVEPEIAEPLQKDCFGMGLFIDTFSISVDLPCPACVSFTIVDNCCS